MKREEGQIGIFSAFIEAFFVSLIKGPCWPLKIPKTA